MITSDLKMDVINCLTRSRTFVIDLPKYEEFVVVYEKPGEARTHLLLGENVLMQCLGYNICKSMLFLKDLLIL